MSTYGERFEIVYRNLSGMFEQHESVRRVKLSQETDRKIRQTAFDELQRLKKERDEYVKDYIEKQDEVQPRLQQEMKDIRTQIQDSKTEEEKNELRLQLQKKKIESEKNITLLSNFLVKNREDVNNVILNARAQIVENQKIKPLKIKDRIVMGIKKFAIRQASAFIAMVDLKLDSDVAAMSRMNVEDIDLASVNKEINGLFDQSESNINNSNIASMVSDFTNREMGQVEGSLGESTVSNSVVVPEPDVNSIDDNMGVEENRGSNEFENYFGIGNIDNSIVADSFVDGTSGYDDSEEEYIEYNDNEQKLAKYKAELDDIRNQVDDAMKNETDAEEMANLKNKMIDIIRNINDVSIAIERESQSRIDDCREQENSAKNKAQVKEEEVVEKNKIVTRQLAASVYGFLDSASNTINTTTDIMKRTAAEISSINSNIESYNASIEQHERKIEELNKMLEEPASKDTTVVSRKI